MPLLVIGGIPLVFIIILIIVVAWKALQHPDTGSLTLSNFPEVFNNRFVFKAILNTLVFAVVAVLTSLVVAVPMAWLVERTTLRGRGIVFPLQAISILVPGFATAMGWIALGHERIGILTRWAADLFGLEKFPLHVGSLAGMGIVQGLSLAGLMFIMVVAVFRAMDPSLEESAEIHGLSLSRRLRKVTFPLAWPGILAASIYIFMTAFAAFEIPAVIGLGHGTFVFSTMLLLLAQPEGGIPQYELASAASFLMLFVSLIAAVWYLRVISQSQRYQVVTGKGYRPKLFELSRSQATLAWTYIGAMISLKLVLPLLALFWTSLTLFFVPPSIEAFGNVTLDSYRSLSWTMAGRAARNTAILFFAVPTITMVFGLAISWVVVRSKMKGVSQTYDMVAFSPHAIPNVILALGAVVLGLQFVPDFIPFYATLYIMLALYVVTRLGFATRIYNSALIQIHRELDEAGSVFGLSRVMVLRKILAPLVAPALVYTWIWMALAAYRELTIAAFLASRENVVLSTLIWSRWQADAPQAAALTMLMILAMAPLLVLYFWVGRRMLTAQGR